jgi:hypothetical protein
MGETVTGEVSMYVEIPAAWLPALNRLARASDEEAGMDPSDHYTADELIAILINNTTLFNFDGITNELPRSKERTGVGWDAQPKRGWTPVPLTGPARSLPVAARPSPLAGP